ncbi:MAG: hypothetical protein HY885_05520 [Deltaproteobacteria bacterium]|nr:hypothetical protein [Deltaproteobacteria bacterium]
MASYEDYKVLRNKIRNYDPLSIVLPCITKLHEISKNAVYANGGYYPWGLLYLIKIAFLEGGKNSNKTATIENINCALDYVNELAKESRFFNGEKGGASKFMRTLAFQQFWFQRSITSSDLARQLLIFDGAAAAKLNEEFLAITGLEINTFLQMLLSAWSGFIDVSGRNYITKEWFAPLGFSEKVIESFFLLVALSVEDTKQFFERHYENTEDKLLQLTEQTPLKQYPFLRINDRYYCYSPYVLQEKIKHAIYDKLKDAQGRDFTQAFGVIFENYINRLMDENNLSYIPEVRLKEIFKKRRVCDAVLELCDAVVLIEVKGVEMHPYAQINPTNAVLTTQLKTSIIKSFEQIYEFGHLLKNTEEGRTILKDKALFAIVVTYKEMYLSDGQDLWNEFLAEPLQTYTTAKNIDSTCVSLRNIFFTSVKSFEELIKVVIANGNIISEILKKAAEDNSDPMKKKYLFDMHLGSYAQTPIPVLDKIFDQAIGELEVKLC